MRFMILKEAVTMTTTQSAQLSPALRGMSADESLERSRRRMLAETERFLAQALREPGRAPVIPNLPVGRRRFSPALVAAFWRRVLFKQVAEWTQNCRRRWEECHERLDGVSLSFDRLDEYLRTVA